MVCLMSGGARPTNWVNADHTATALERPQESGKSSESPSQSEIVNPQSRIKEPGEINPPGSVLEPMSSYPGPQWRGLRCYGNVVRPQAK